MSFRVRPARAEDFEAIYEMAKLTGGGFTNLPPDKATLVAKLARSDDSFARVEDGQQGDMYMFVLEDPKEGLIRGIENYQVVLNEERITAAKLDRQLVKKAIRGWLEAQPGVAWVVDLQDLDAHPVPEPIRTMAINGYHRLRSGSMLIIFDPGWFFGYARTGTTHSTWHPYDTHIPMLWYGWQIRTGKTNRRVHMEDIAPTLAAMLHIQPPNGCMGQVIREMAR